MIRRNKQKRKPNREKWAMTAAVVLLAGICTTLGTAQAKEETLASRGCIIFEDSKGGTERLEWNAEDLLLLKEKLASIPEQCFDPACYTHDHNWVYQNINESTHTKHCDGCGAAYDSISAHMAAYEERCVISHNGREYPGQKSICECGWHWMRETAHTLVYEPSDAVNHTLRCALDDSAYCRGYEPVTEEHYAYYYVPDEDGMHHEKVCLDCGYREEEPCSFTLEEAPMREETEDGTPQDDQTVEDEDCHWCVCGNCTKQEEAPPETSEEPDPNAPTDEGTMPPETPEEPDPNAPAEKE